MTALLQSPGLVGPITFWQTSHVGAGSVLLTQDSNVGQRLIICWVGLVNTAGSPGDYALISLNGIAFHSGAVGSGFPDRFPLDCLLAVERFDTVALTVAGTGTWATVGVGYYGPAFNIG